MRSLLIAASIILSLIFSGIARGQDAPTLAPASLRTPGTAEKLGYHPGDTAIIIPAYVRLIPAYCFAGCEGLKSVEFAPDSQLAQISAFAFAECEDLEEIGLPQTLKILGDGAFRGCRSLRKISIPSGVTELPREAFAYCRSLVTVALPPTLRKINPLAFLDCQSLLLEEIPKGVSSIGNNAFGRCYSIRRMTLPVGCREVESYAFADCTALEEITLPAKTEMLGELLFSGCSNLRTVTSPAFVPPIIECNSTLFEPDDIKARKDCRILVAKGRVEAYRRSPFWNHFSHISEIK